ncbi:hypothetical protein PA598K_01498 [Paenibacillus sp. 598K]|uniref:HK97 gp10 family phage protein n=1 Tax=Paenibacillus sp. 598K TaxID=1117987 RepID=UPI000FF94F42|nr:HK97 gp10 family phage protein [Paenibacillus sp. 598K]GBF73213.1 hypothetical protein PA598K_01498 [Paenibacillus sp. 598K]
MKELERAMKRLGKVPQTIVTQAARAGATIPLRASKANAPEDTGDLKSGIIMKKERRTKIGKAVYDIMMDPAKNDIFVKTTKDGTRYYYPASMEYGFMTVDGGYVPGYRFLRRGLVENVTRIESRVIEVAGKAVDKAWRAR